MLFFKGAKELATLLTIFATIVKNNNELLEEICKLATWCRVTLVPKGQVWTQRFETAVHVSLKFAP